MHPIAINASYFPVAASFFAARGNSNEPGTRTTSTSLLCAPDRSRASTAAASNRSVIKLLKRLAISAKRKPSALNAPSTLPGWSFSLIEAVMRPFASLSLSLLSLELRRPLFKKRFGSFAHVLRRAGHAEKRGFEEEAFFQRHLASAFDCFHGELHADGTISDDFFRHRFGRREQFCRLVNVIDQADAQRLF